MINEELWIGDFDGPIVFHELVQQFMAELVFVLLCTTLEGFADEASAFTAGVSGVGEGTYEAAPFKE